MGMGGGHTKGCVERHNPDGTALVMLLQPHEMFTMCRNSINNDCSWWKGVEVTRFSIGDASGCSWEGFDTRRICLPMKKEAKRQVML